MTGAPTQAEPLPSAVRPTRLTDAGGLHVGQAEPRRAAQVQGRHVELGEAGQHGVAGRAPARRRPRARRARARARRRRSARAPAPKSRPASVPEGATRANASSAGRCRPGIGQRGATISATPSVPTTPVRLAVPAEDAGDRDHADRAPPLHAVGGGRVQGEAHVGVAALLDQHDAAVGARVGGVGQAALDQLLGRDHPRAPPMLSAPTPRAR